jgi:hypothetical protein
LPRRSVSEDRCPPAGVESPKFRGQTLNLNNAQPVGDPNRSEPNRTQPNPTEPIRTFIFPVRGPGLIILPIPIRQNP